MTLASKLKASRCCKDRNPGGIVANEVATVLRLNPTSFPLITEEYYRWPTFRYE
jgi:hypothetical protein